MRGRRPSVITAVLGVLLAVGCSDRADQTDDGQGTDEADDDADIGVPSDLGGDDGLAPTVDESTQSWAEALCDKVAECGCEGAGSSTCVDDVVSRQQTAWANAGYPDDVVTDEACLRDRSQAMRDLPCASVEAVFGVSEQDPAFQSALCRVMQGTKAIGEACVYDQLAESCGTGPDGGHCNPGSGQCEGFSEFVGLGDACDSPFSPGASRICDGNAVCDAPIDGSGVCVEVQPGDPCIDGVCPVRSPSGYLQCNIGTDTCLPRSTVGGACVGDSDCQSFSCDGQICQPSGQAYVCLSAAGYDAL